MHERRLCLRVVLCWGSGGLGHLGGSRGAVASATVHALTHLTDASDAKSWLFDDKIPARLPTTASSVQQNGKPSLVHTEEFSAFAEGILTDERLWFVGVFSRLVDTYSIRDM